ncbi:hypothetical protein QUF70_21600 [Desulfobacterales bacterium HSG17]|nr:hypothetical protein [Desulfobacterales bacterium HSG17]
MSKTISSFNETNSKNVFLSGHDSCDHALMRMQTEINAQTTVLKAGKIYRF